MVYQVVKANARRRSKPVATFFTYTDADSFLSGLYRQRGSELHLIQVRG